MNDGDDHSEHDTVLTAGLTSTLVRADQARPPLARGTSLGRYTVLEPLGAGAMGVVYKAYDRELDRLVALKLLAAFAGGQLRDRLLREAQALARVAHPNVIAVHEIGALDGDVFIAMEFVAGLTLRDWLDATPRARGEILAVFLAAGEGLVAAHRVGLVHRDFKPDNVMVGDDGRVRVLDFGVARAAGGPEPPGARLLGTESSDTGPVAAPAHNDGDAVLATADPSLSQGHLSRLSTPLTQVGSIIGTPRYMAPEQYRGEDVDERADQFAFCVSLYQGLYGVLPFAGATLRGLRGNVLSGRVLEPPPGTRVPRWLRQVLLRGLALAPAERYPSMAALLAALRADPAQARARWLRAAGVVAVAASVLLGWGFQQRRQAHACAGAERKLAGVWDDGRRVALRTAFRTSGAPYAATALRSVESALDRYAQAWREMHTDACEATRVRGEQSEELLDLRMSCLDERRTQLETLTGLYKHADGKLVERAAEAVQSLPPVAGCADLVALRSPVPLPRDKATLDRLHEIRRRLARADALELASQIEPGIELASAVLADARALGYGPLLADAELTLGRLESRRDGVAAGLELWHRAFSDGLAARSDRTAATAAIHIMRAYGRGLGRYEDADRWAAIAEAASARLSRKDELLGLFYQHRAVLRGEESHYDEQLADARRALELRLRSVGESHHTTASSYNGLGLAYYNRGQIGEALASSRHALGIVERTFGRDHPKMVPVLINIGNQLSDLGRGPEARAEYERALAIQLRVGPEHPDVATLYNNIGGTILEPLQALGYFERALADYAKHAAAPTDMVRTLDNIGSTQLELARLSDAAATYARSLALAEQELGPRHTLAVEARSGVAEVARQRGKLDAAQALFARAIADLEATPDSPPPALINPLVGLARVHLDRKQPAQARPLLERALGLARSDENPVVAAEIEFLTAQALWALGTHVEARKLATAAHETYAQRVVVPLPEETAEVAAWLHDHVLLDP